MPPWGGSTGPTARPRAAAHGSRCTWHGGPLTSASRTGTSCSWASGGCASGSTRLEEAVDDLERLELLGQCPKLGNVGTKKNWVDVASVKADAKDLVALASELRDALVQSALDVVVAALAQAVLDEADRRRRDGSLQFQDLLVLARNVLRDSEAARMAAHQRYQRLLLDEFQDTDPLQIEIAVRIVAGADGGHARWQDCPVPAGSLFVVGDAKQSIYRFRRANIATFLEAQDVLAGEKPAVLSTNFRSHPAVLEWANTVFARLIVAEPGGQPPYQPLDPDPDRVVFHAHADDARVVVLGSEPVGVGLKADELREYEAQQVAGAIATLLRDAPAVEHRVDEHWESRPLTAADVCVLVPARTSLNELERALNALNVPFRTEASSLVYRSDEVRDLLLTARAIDDPTDELALVEALRTPLFGCGDDDLVTWKAAGGRFSVFAKTPDAVGDAHPVAESLAFLKRMARQRSLVAPSELLATIVTERRALEVATDSPQYRETWRRLRFVVDQARAWSEAEHGSLRDFLDWAMRQAEEEERANEIVLPEKDVQAIRILTVHAAKGLEFPVVVLSGMASSPMNSPGRLVWPDTGPPEVSVSTAARTAGWAGASDRESWMLHLESLRLLYVAATRAESRLVVSLVRDGATQRPAGGPAELDPSRTDRRGDRGCPVRGVDAGPRRGRTLAVPSRSRSSLRWSGMTGSLRGIGRARLRSSGRLTRPPTSPTERSPCRRESNCRLACSRNRGTSSCRRGSRAATGLPWGARCMRRCKRSTS